ncbi:hypothetical protein PFISCL1PPCAC_5026, partial [Pristionchus fissidentatus]
FSAMLWLEESISSNWALGTTLLGSPRMSQHTEDSSGMPSPDELTAPLFTTTDREDTSSLLDGATPVPCLLEDDRPNVDFQLSSIGVVYSDYYDRIRDDAEWNELGQMRYVPLYSPRTSHGSFSSDRMSSEGSVSPSLPSPIGEHLKSKRDSQSSVHFPIVAGAPQPFPDPFSDREAWTAGNNGRRGGKNSNKPSYGTILEPKNDYGATGGGMGGGEYGSSSQDSHTEVFGGSQESLNNGYGGGQKGYGGGGGGDYGGRGYGRHNNRSNSHSNGDNGGRRMGGGAPARRQHYNSVGYGNNYSSNDYGNNGGSSSYYDQHSSYDQPWRNNDFFESTNKYGGPIHHGGGGGAPSAPSGPLPNAFSRANINDEQKNNLMANLARLCNQRTY